jgi:hypothetical protein
MAEDQGRYRKRFAEAVEEKKKELMSAARYKDLPELEITRLAIAEVGKEQPTLLAGYHMDSQQI